MKNQRLVTLLIILNSICIGLAVIGIAFLLNHKMDAYKSHTHADLVIKLETEWRVERVKDFILANDLYIRSLERIINDYGSGCIEYLAFMSLFPISNVLILLFWRNRINPQSPK